MDYKKLQATFRLFNFVSKIKMKIMLSRLKTLPPIFFPAICFILVFSTYLPAIFNEFAYDDNFYIASNISLRSNTSFSYHFTNPDIKLPVYRPLSMWFFSIESHLFQIDPFYFHTINIILHAIVTVLFLLLLYQLTGNWWLSLGASLLFGLHPANTESVAWAWQQSNIIANLFLLATILFGIIYEGRGKLLILFILSTMAVFSKENAAILPLIYILALIMMRINLKSKWKEIITVTLPIVIYIAARLYLLPSFSQMPPWRGSRYTVFLTMLSAVKEYFRISIWPNPLSVQYDLFPLRFSIFEKDILLSVALIIILSVYCLIQFKKARLISLGFLWATVGYLPVSNVLFPMQQVLAERFLYFILPGITVILVGLIMRFELSNNFPKITASFFILILPVFSYLTFTRLFDWFDDRTLWKHELFIGRDDWKTHFNYGVALAFYGDYEDSKTEIKKACDRTQGEIFHSACLQELSIIELISDNPEMAVVTAEKMVKLYPSNKVNLKNLGKIYFSTGNYDKAKIIFEKLSKEDNLNLQYLFFDILSGAASQNQNGAPAEIDFSRFKNESQREQAREIIFGKISMTRGKNEEATEHFKKGLSRHFFQIPEAYIWFGDSLLNVGKYEEARDIYRIALYISPYNIAVASRMTELEKLSKEKFE